MSKGERRRGLWRRFTRIGVDPRASPLETRHIVAVNSLTILAIVADVLILPFDLGRNFSWALAALHAGVLTLYASILGLNHRGFSTVASVLLISAVLGGTLVGVLVQGPASGVHFGFLAEVLGAFLIFHHRARWLAFIFATIAGALFVATSAAALDVDPATVAAEGPMFRSASTQVVILVLIVCLIARRVAAATESHIRDEREGYRRLLRSLYPPPAADALAAGGSVLPRRHAVVSVVSCDIVGFTALSEENAPEVTVRLLDTLFSAYDRSCLEIGVEKIKTVGDGYIAASGLWGAPDAAARALRLARAMAAATAELATARGLPLRVRIGVASGAAVSGVIGRQKATFDLWGEAVTRVRALERGAEPGEILVDERSAALLGDEGEICSIVDASGSPLAARRFLP